MVGAVGYWVMGAVLSLREVEEGRMPQALLDLDGLIQVGHPYMAHA